MCIGFRHLVNEPTALTRGLASNGLIQVRNVPSYLRHAWGTGDLSRIYAGNCDFVQKTIYFAIIYDK